MTTQAAPSSRISLQVVSDRPAVSGGARPSIPNTLLSAQRELTAVERFSDHHSAFAPAKGKYYRDLIPRTAPGPGEQYAFEVDLDACSGCKSCVSACHTLNGLDEEETWRTVGLLAGGAAGEGAVVQHVTSACHHCIEPACLEGCPVLAYEKDPVTGIVRHLDDQCIGCQYCILKCPYDVPKYNKSKGIVRKCDMCSDRLSEGEAPACVQGCPNGAIRITVVDQQRVVRQSESHVFVPGAAEPDYTLPTTEYKRNKSLPRDTLPVDYYQVAPEHAHGSLTVMLVLTQLSVGAFLVAQLGRYLIAPGVLHALAPIHATGALVVGLLALGASTLHLGRPHLAFRAVLGLRTSWLSREILAFGGFAGLASAYAAAFWLMPGAHDSKLVNWLGVGVAVGGLAGVVCSVMIYHDTRRAFWHARSTATKFLLSTFLLGMTACALSLAVATAALRLPAAVGSLRTALQCIAILAVAKVLFELVPLRHLRSKVHSPMKRTALLLAGPLKRVLAARVMLGLIGGVMLPALSIPSLSPAGRELVPSEVLVFSAATFAMTLVAELLERYLFFTAVVAPRMPGSVHA